MGQAFNQQVLFEDIGGVINMEPLIYDPKAKPRRNAGWPSFLKKFIFVLNQSNQVWQLRLLISTTCLIMAVEAKRIQGPLDISKPFTESEQITNSSRTDAKFLSEGSRDVFCSFYDPMNISKLFTGSDRITYSSGAAAKFPPRRAKDAFCSFYDPMNISKPFTESEAYAEFLSIRKGKSIADEGKCQHFKNYSSKIDKIECHGRHLDERESTPAQFSQPNILGPNQSDPVWQLRLLAAFSLVYHTTMGVLILPGDLQGVHTTYRRSVMLITSFGVPIVVAVISLLVSIWLVPDPSGRSNWITGLSVANFSLLGGRLAVYWTLKRGAENILIGQES